jgi:hypothetical protein
MGRVAEVPFGGRETFDEHCHSELVTDSRNTVWLSSLNPRVVGPSNMPFYPLVEANLKTFV